MTKQEYTRLFLSPKALWFAASKMYLNFLWYFIPIGALPFLFAGFKWNKFDLSPTELTVTLLLLSFVLFLPCFVVCYFIHFNRSKNSAFTDISEKAAGIEVANIFP